MSAMGNPVALEARAEEREVRGIDFNDDYAVSFGIVRELNIGSADDLNGFHDVIRIFLQTLL